MDERSMYDLLLEQGLTEEQIQQILALSEAGTEGDILSRQAEFAEGLRDMEGPRGRGWGRVYKAAHPLEHAGVMAQRLYGGYRTGEIEEERRDLAGRQTSARAALLRALGRAPKPVQGANQFGPAGPAQTTPLEPLAMVPRDRWTPIG